MKRPFQEGEILEVTPTRIGRRGDAEGLYEGWRLRIAGAIPGERARVRVLHVSRGGKLAAGRWMEACEEPDPARRSPVCRIHERCGGCGLQQIATPAALRLKVEQARKLLPGVEAWQEPIASPREYGYRAKTFLLPQRRGGRLVLGARPPRGSKLVDTSGCPVLRPALESLAHRVRQALEPDPGLEARLRSVLLRCNRAGETQLTFVHRAQPGDLAARAHACGATRAFLQRHDRPGNRIHSDEPEQRLSGGGPIMESYTGGIEGPVPPTAFFQGNPEVADGLYRAVAAAVEGERILELYCGSGVARLLALRSNPGATLTGIDKAPRAIHAARASAGRNGLANRCEFLAAPAEEALGDWDAVILNPPRAGCGEAVLEAVARSRAKRLVYLSCSPATLARDVQRLGWPILSAQPADMFPQTPHLEILAVLTRP